MKILHLIPSCEARAGGPVEALKQIAREVTKRGVELHVVCLDEPGSCESDRVFTSVTRLGRGKGKYGYNPLLVTWLRENLQRFDAVVLNGLWQFHGLALLLTIRKAGRPFFVFPHGMLDPWFKERYPLKHLKKLFYWTLVERRVIAHAKNVLFTSETERREAARSFPWYSARAVVTAYGTSPPPVSSGPASIPGVVANRRNIVFMGRIHEKKGCDLLIEAFGELARSRPEFHLTIAGPDEAGLVATLKQDLARRNLTDRASWPGLVTGQQKWDLLRSADVFCLPSHQENFGVAVAEALACGVPVLISNKVNIWEEVVASGAGLAEDDTGDGTRRLLEKWSRLSDGDRLKMRVAAKACFQERFHIDTVADSYLKIVAEDSREKAGVK